MKGRSEGESKMLLKESSKKIGSSCYSALTETLVIFLLRKANIDGVSDKSVKKQLFGKEKCQHSNTSEI